MQRRMLFEQQRIKEIQFFSEYLVERYQNTVVTFYTIIFIYFFFERKMVSPNYNQSTNDKALIIISKLCTLQQNKISFIPKRNMELTTNSDYPNDIGQIIISQMSNGSASRPTSRRSLAIIGRVNKTAWIWNWISCFYSPDSFNTNEFTVTI